MKKTISLLVLCFALQADIGTAEYQRSAVPDTEQLFLLARYEDLVERSTWLINARSGQLDELYYLKGLGQLKLGKFTEARDAFRTVIAQYASSKRSFDAYMGIGDAFYLEGNASAALEAYREIARKFSQDKNITLVDYRIGLCYLQQGMADKAASNFDTLRRTSPLSFEARMAQESSMRTFVPAVSGDKKAALHAEPKDYYSIQVGKYVGL